MKEPFEEIRITDLDVDLTEPSQEGPGFQRLFLKLSQRPPPEWIKIFEEVRRFPSHRIWRNAWVVDAHIVVECIPQELEQFQLNHLKKDVANTNKKFSGCACTQKAEMRQQQQERAEARRELEHLRTRLRFD